MPRGDGTGPQGKGPRTGRGMGRCVGGAVKRPIGQGQGQGQGQGRGQGRGQVLRGGFGRANKNQQNQ